MSFLASALLSFAVAIFTLVGTQWVLHRRERTKLLTDKLEALCGSLSALMDRHDERFAQLLMPKKLTNREALDFTALDITNRQGVLVRFYFPQLRADFEPLWVANQKIIILIRRWGGDDPTVSLEEFEQHHSELSRLAGEIFSKILGSKAQLTRDFLGSARAKWEAVSEGNY